MTMRFNTEAKLIAARWCVKTRPVAEWMRARSIEAATDFQHRWPGSWDESNDAALADFWDWATADLPPAPRVELTDIGEQYVMPGCERKIEKPGVQLGLWD